MDPRAYNKPATNPQQTRGKRVGYVCIPDTGTVSVGAGAVLLGPTRTVPMQNPNN